MGGALTLQATEAKTTTRKAAPSLPLPVPVTASTAPAPSGPATPDPLNRTTPQSTMFGFLEACRAGNYAKAARYLDLREKSLEERAKIGPPLAQQLQEILDHSADFDLGQLSNEPLGDLSDGLTPDLETIETYEINKSVVSLDLHRVEGKSGNYHWLVTPESLTKLPELHSQLVETPFEKALPSPFVTKKILDTSLWQWIAYLLLVMLLLTLSRLLSRAVVAMINLLLTTFSKEKSKLLNEFARPLWMLLSITIFRAALEVIGGSVLVRLYITRGLAFLFFWCLAWLAGDFVDLLAARTRSRLSPQQRAVSYSVLPLFQRMAKIGLFAIALLVTLSHWGYNTNTILAGLGVGGLAVALAAQKTLENLFGGVSVISDRPVLVGDACRFPGQSGGIQAGTVEDIGLRSTRIRTAERTLVSVPNSQFSIMTLENLSARDRFWFHQTLRLRGDATTEQIQQVIAGIERLLRERGNVDSGKMPVLFTAIGNYSFELQISAYVNTLDENEFNRTQSELLMKIVETVEAAGTGIAIPVQESRNPPQALASAPDELKPLATTT